MYDFPQFSGKKCANDVTHILSCQSYIKNLLPYTCFIVSVSFVVSGVTLKRMGTD